MSDKLKASTATRLAVAGLIVAGGATAAITANANTTTPSSSPSASAPATSGPRDGDHGGHRGTHTAVTGTEKARVVSAVKAKDKALTVTDVSKDADGSYDVRATSAGKPVMVHVSKDLKTVEVRTFDGHKGGPGGRGGHDGRHRGTEVTGTELAKVKAAVVAKNAGVTVEHVMKESDGTYHVMATKSGTRVMYRVSKDLGTVSVDTRGPRDGKAPQGAPGGKAPQGAPSGKAPQGAPGSTASKPA